MSLILILATTAAVFAYIGRASLPPRQHLAGRVGTLSGFYRNMILGLELCSMNSPLARILREPVRGSRPASRDRVRR